MKIMRSRAKPTLKSPQTRFRHSPTNKNIEASETPENSSSLSVLFLLQFIGIVLILAFGVIIWLAI